ncbi:MAG: DUF1593 domain-containing protein, partial [bacterium]|nr:DUF1593 domain-containing protein [bacterium]
MKWTRLAALLTASCAAPVPEEPSAPAPAETSGERTRLLVLTDIGNEPDDAQSMVRFLLYANEFDVEGLVATTSTWQRTEIQPQLIRERVEAYGKVRNNLLAHAPGYPTAGELLALIKSGRPEYGMAAVGEGADTEGSDWIISVVDKPDPRPVWITVWGGAVDLAQALWKVRETRSAEELAKFVGKIRVYTISDQDDTGPWMRRTFPKLFYIVSVHEFASYAMSTWCGISGEQHYHFEGPPDFHIVSNDWLDEHVRTNHGPLGALYPRTAYIMEGDTPSFLYLIPNGLGVPEHPEYGSWGGRYGIAEEGAGHWADTVDTVEGAGGKMFTSNQATVWRWREAYQHDFAARMDWTTTADVAGANHNPQLVLNGVEGKQPVSIEVASGDGVKLSAAGSKDPNGDALTYRWFQYVEATGRRAGRVEIADPSAEEITFHAPKVRVPQTLHIFLEAVDDGTPR